MERDPRTVEQLWKDPPWQCPQCRWMNVAIRERCRNCGFDSALVSGDCYFSLEAPGTANATSVSQPATPEATK